MWGAPGRSIVVPTLRCHVLRILDQGEKKKCRVKLFASPTTNAFRTRGSGLDRISLGDILFQPSIPIPRFCARPRQVCNGVSNCDRPINVTTNLTALIITHSAAAAAATTTIITRIIIFFFFIIIIYRVNCAGGGRRAGAHTCRGGVFRTVNGVRGQRITSPERRIKTPGSPVLGPHTIESLRRVRLIQKRPVPHGVPEGLTRPSFAGQQSAV